jgi:3'-phosphoadenosine 5'-phosphosulfate sulfotransferase (PAPS reductase)/FAD synthetase
MTRTLAKHRRLFISFSGGKTSAYMTVRLLTQHRHEWDEVVVLFANTGEEHEKTLRYVQRIAEHYSVPVVWVEAVVNPEAGKGTTHTRLSRLKRHRARESRSRRWWRSSGCRTKPIPTATEN